ncbi:zinc finger CCHC domain-containing protein 8-like isoform X2 [Dioscorea cayenensis subsp. rotundata]|uniref:Zinc finger CCHC domain-containing protein 8-like isoform X2 n=1 Tax=Dioscorea cayennensis subsp. rotundata TaxID=55577 RepID=A0AB40CWE1_DIOCR|nr:zinc finger CCHC domain-containing protein 8-like isoform X2 [Dioscorea cayenensis subsp. rotundata]
MMDSNNFTDPDTSGTSNGRGEENVPELLNTVPDENNLTESTSQTTIPIGDSIEEVDMDIEEEEGQYSPIVNVEVEAQQKDSALSQSSELTTSVTMLEKEDPQQDQENGHAIIQNVITGAKRARITYDDQQPSVHVVYKSLTRESKKKLMQLMQHWSEWEAQRQSSSDVSSEEAFESGEETYFPALSLRSGRSSTVSFWLDNMKRKEEINDIQLENESVPLYDRGYTLGSTSLDGSTNSNWIETPDTSRCFNCGSYSHMLRECPRPRNRYAISNARRLHGSKRNQPSGPRVQIRYYQKSSGKIDDDIKPGVLGTEAKESLGIRESDPLPWLHRTQEPGHPPGYLEGAEDEDQPSGITIFSEEEEIKEEYEEGELPEKAEPETPLRKMAAEFSGINAPSPANANQRLWAVHSGGFPGSYPSKHHRFSRSSHSSESHGGRSHERWSEDHRDNRLPSSDTGGYYSPRYSPYGQHPALNRSLSDRERGTPLPDKNSANPFTYPPPPPPPGTTRHSSYHSPTTSGEHWKNYSSYNGITSPSVSSQQARDRHDHHFRNHSRR